MIALRDVTVSAEGVITAVAPDGSVVTTTADVSDGRLIDARVNLAVEVLTASVQPTPEPTPDVLAPEV